MNLCDASTSGGLLFEYFKDAIRAGRGTTKLFAEDGFDDGVGNLGSVVEEFAELFL